MLNYRLGFKFAANPVNGTGSMTVLIALSHDSGASNGPFGTTGSITEVEAESMNEYQQPQQIRIIFHVSISIYPSRQKKFSHPSSLQRKNTQIPNAPLDLNVADSARLGATDISECASRRRRISRHLGQYSQN